MSPDIWNDLIIHIETTADNFSSTQLDETDKRVITFMHQHPQEISVRMMFDSTKAVECHKISEPSFDGFEKEKDDTESDTARIVTYKKKQTQDLG